jgi:serine/threonine protein kinase
MADNPAQKAFKNIARYAHKKLLGRKGTQNAPPKSAGQHPAVHPGKRERDIRDQVERRQRAWLNSEVRWKNRVGRGWIGKRVLGKGSYGIVGHWAYDEDDRSKRRGLLDVVVKQSAVMRGGKITTGLFDEEMMLKSLNAANSQHIVRLYRHLYQEQGNFTVEFDKGPVHRVFLEYCSGGDFDKWQSERLQK